MRFEKTIILRVPMEMYNNYLIKIENYSQYLRDLIEKDIMEKRNPVFIKNVINQKKEEIKHLEELLSAPHPMVQKAMDLLSKHAKNFKEHAPNRTIEQRHRFIENVLLPDLNKFGLNKTVAEIDSILLNFPDEERDDGHD
jgi:hypothetical protein